VPGPAAHAGCRGLATDPATQATARGRCTGFVIVRTPSVGCCDGSAGLNPYAIEGWVRPTLVCSSALGLSAEPGLAAASVCRVPKELEHKYLAGFVAGHAAAACTANHA